jgi:hypothetical protein
MSPRDKRRYYARQTRLRRRGLLPPQRSRRRMAVYQKRARLQEEILHRFLLEEMRRYSPLQAIFPQKSPGERQSYLFTTTRRLCLTI